jgi:DNA-binding transcriptional LysR family regulator
LELHQVRYFLALAQSLNFTRAAEQCSVTQPALTKAIQKLEQELGGELLYRERQLTQLTDLGKLLLPMFERTLSAAESIRVQADEFRHKAVAPLKIGLAPCISGSLLATPLLQIAETMPGLQVELEEASPKQLIEMLLEGHVNAAIAAADVGTLPDRIDFWRLFEERFTVLVAQQGPFAGDGPIPGDALSEAVWLEHIGCDTARRFWAERQSGLDQIRVSHRSRRLDHLQQLVKAGLGVMLAPEHMPHISDLTRRVIAGDEFRREIRLLVMSGRRYVPALGAFVQLARTRNWRSDFDPTASNDHAAASGAGRFKRRMTATSNNINLKATVAEIGLDAIK